MKILLISSLAYLFLPARRLIAWHIELLLRTSKLADKSSSQATEQQGNQQGGQSTKEQTIQMQTPDWVEEKDCTTMKYMMMKVKMLFKKTISSMKRQKQNSNHADHIDGDDDVHIDLFTYMLPYLPTCLRSDDTYTPNTHA